MALEERRRELDNKEVCLEKNEKDCSSESQKHKADICEKENMLRIQEEDLNVLELKIKEAKSKLTSNKDD